MKKIYLLLIIAVCCFASNVYAKNNMYFENSNGISFTEEKYNNFKLIGFSDEEINAMSRDTFNEYKDMDKVLLDKEITKYFRETIISGYDFQRTVVEEITQEEYDSEAIARITNTRTNSVTYETTYKKLVVSSYSISTNYPALRAVNSVLTWKLLPSTRSYDIFAARVTGGEIATNAYSGTMTSRQTTFDSNCAISGTQNHTQTFTVGHSSWNKQTSGIGYAGLGFTAELVSSSEVCTNDLGIFVSTAVGYNASLSFRSVEGATVYVSYQHATQSVSYSSVYHSYSFSSSGLGGVIYFSNSTLMNSYDGMGGVSLTL